MASSSALDQKKPGRGTEPPAGREKLLRSDQAAGLLLPLLTLVADQFHHAGVRGVRDLHQHQQVIAAEAVCALPLAVLGAVEALEGDVEARPAFAFVPPDCGLDAADADFLDRLRLCSVSSP